MAYSLVVRRWKGFGIGLTLLALPQTGIAEVAGKAVSVSGRVLVRNEDAAKPEMRQLKPGDELTPGAVINTDSAGSAKILLTDKSIIDLGPSTLFKVDDYRGGATADRKVAMTMSYGKIRASVNTPVGPHGKYQLRSKSVTMGVRGTEFIVASDLMAFTQSTLGEPAAQQPATLQTQVTVVHGKVEVSEKAEDGKGEKMVAALTNGQQLTKKEADSTDQSNTATRAPASETPVVTTLSATEVQEVKAEAKQLDTTFKRAIVIDDSNKSDNGQWANLPVIDPTTLPAINLNPQIFVPANFGTLNGMPVTLRVVFRK